MNQIDLYRVQLARLNTALKSIPEHLHELIREAYAKSRPDFFSEVDRVKAVIEAGSKKRGEEGQPKVMVPRTMPGIEQAAPGSGMRFAIKDEYIPAAIVALVESGFLLTFDGTTMVLKSVASQTSTPM